jgi:hypothetical protein
VITNGASASVKDFDECCSDETKVIADLIQLSIRICGPVAPCVEPLKPLRELGDLSTCEQVSPIYIVKIYCGLVDKDEALTWLRKAYGRHSDHSLIIGVDPAYDPPRSDPRFIEMLRGASLAP